MSTQHIAVVDFGSYLTRLLIVQDTDPMRVVVYASEKSQGISHGVIVDLEKASLMLKNLLDQVKPKLNYRISRVYCSISGETISSVSSHSVVKIRHEEVSRYDVEDLYSTAAAITLDNQKVIHILPKQYKVDNQSGIMDPVGMYGVRLEGDFHLVLVDQGVAQNIARCFSRVGIEIIGFIFMPLGLVEAVLYDDEKQQGTVLIDMGEGTTDFVVCHDGVVKYTGSVPLGGGAVTRDIAHKLRVDNEVAERFKLAVMKNNSDEICFEEGISLEDIQNVISARYMQILKLIEQNILREGLKKSIDRGVVLCGSSAQYPYLQNLIEEKFSYHCRMGGLIDDDVPLTSQAWLGTVGLVYFVRKNGATVLGRNNPCRRAFKMLQRWLEVYF